MKSPSNPGRIIQEALDELCVSVADASDALGVPHRQLHDVVEGRSAISPEMAVRLEKALGSNAAFWLRLQMNYDLAQIGPWAESVQVRSLVHVQDA